MSRKLIVIGTGQGKVFIVDRMSEGRQLKAQHYWKVTSIKIVEDKCILSASIDGTILVHALSDDIDEMKLCPLNNKDTIEITALELKFGFNMRKIELIIGTVDG